ncbi:PREDICTED: dentin sialophosphoprotein-like isoform X3 [Camelina sativa]|uniref:Dentin sialophosphoprotein-like isoform X3 n=1 Tax=Camelina sativa TaxID=90675 RepID=A0ABM1R1A8_CAMSA|nr:PREDICTED: dentin sialophosphoprotein-like isoform X3 [Camelina sativa]
MADRRLGYRSMSRRGRPKMQSGTCNVCSAPCSSCMHRNAGFTGSKSDESSSDENSHGVLASECSFNERSYGVNALGNTASEARNLVNSNHDTSSSENAESKEIIRSSDRSHGSLLDGSRKDQDSMKLDTCNDHKAKNILGQGKVKEKSGAKSNKDNKNNSLIESSTRSGPMVRKSGENVPSNKADESNTSAMSESESEGVDSEMLELDVKVCDTCGDAGREDLLAICSRCSDGAEHTYCMRVMLKKVPKGDWLCEECKFAEEAEKKKLETKAKRESAVNLNTQSSSKRHMDKFEAAPDSKRLAVEAPTGSPKRSVLPRSSALSRETSFKGLEKPTRKLAHHSSFNSHSSDDSESTRSPDSQLRSPKGSFFKSNSFNSSSSRPKVRTVDDVMLPRQKTGKDNSSLDLKEGFSRNVGKSMSSRCIDVGSSSCYDSKVNGTKQLKDRSIEANPSASTIDQKLISRGRSSSSYAKSPRDLKDLESDGQQGSLTKQARHLSRNRLEDIVASVGDSSTNEKCSSSEAKCKNELANVDGLLRPREVREAGEKSKDAAGNHQTLNIREDINKGNRLRAAVDAALRKKPNFGKSRGLEQSDLPSVSNVDSGCDKALRNMSSKVPVIRDWPVGFKGLPGGHPNLGTDKQTIAVNGTQSLPGADAMAASLSVVPEVHVPSIKPVMRDFPVAAPAVLSTTSAIPEPEYIWQGDLEVEKSRNLSRMHNGMQAYLSTLASPKVVEVVNQFPVILTLNEVPRLSAWPAQFQDLGAKEQHVALFFFAKDIESYEKNYKPLVDNMIQKDLALKGNLEGVELLVFASNQLPRDCQPAMALPSYWNTVH